MALDARYITSVDLNPYLCDKETGEPLAYGTIEFWKDTDRVSPKLVYQLTGSPPNYTYTPMADPIILSPTGTIQDANGNQVALYYFPYESTDSDADIELYYIVVKNALGVPQFTREAWPNLAISPDVVPAEDPFDNNIQNSQFVDVSFNPASTLTISYTGTVTTTVQVAPEWTLVIGSSGTGSVDVQRTAIAGDSNYPNNPPYTLTITPGANVASLMLYQRLENNPGIWSPQSGGSNGYLASSILLAPLTSATIKYAPSTGTSQTLLQTTNLDAEYKQVSNTVQLIASDNTATADTGYVDIQLVLNISNPSTFSNVQVVNTATAAAEVTYQQQTVNEQKAALFNYYNPLLQYKPIPSYLIGWDFYQNPAQFLGTSVAAQSVGANKSYYAWDQTILFQSANSALTVTRSGDGNGAMRITAAVDTQFAMVQYLPQNVARKILNDRIAANVQAITSQADGIVATVSLWYTTDGSLPAIGSNNSLIATLDATGVPATFHGNWTQVPRSNLGPAQFTVLQPTTNNFEEFGFNGWDMQGVAATNTATFFAIVVGFATLTNTNVVDVDSISVVAGDIPTKPAPKSSAETLIDCQQFYAKSFLPTTVPAQNAGAGSGDFQTSATRIGNNPNWLGTIYLPAMMNVAPTVTFYNPSAANALIRDFSAGVDFTTSAAANVKQKSFSVTGNGNGSTNNGNEVGVHWTADARLGF